MGKAKNIIVLAMSTLNSKPMVNQYKLQEESEVYYGICQLEPITKCVIDMLGKQNEVIDEVIILNTNETMSETKIEYTDEECTKKTETISPNQFYQNRIRAWATEEYSQLYCDDTIHFHDSIIVDEKEPTKGVSQLVELVLEHYSCGSNGKSKLFLDTQGSFRDVVFIMTSVIHMLKIRNIIPDGIYSIPFNPNRTKEASLILDKRNSYAISDFVSGMDEFIHYGRCKQLMAYYEKREKKQGIEKVLDEIKAVSDAISLCDVDSLFEHIIKLLEVADKYEKSGEIFDLFVEDIKLRYADLVEDKKINYIKVVRWSIEREFYQQALTIIESKFPKIFFENRWYYFDESDREEIQSFKYPKFKMDENYFFDSYWKKAREKVCEKYLEYICCKNEIRDNEHSEDLTNALKGLKGKKIKNVLGLYNIEASDNIYEKFALLLNGIYPHCDESTIEKYKEKYNGEITETFFKNSDYIYDFFNLKETVEFEKHENIYEEFHSYFKYFLLGQECEISLICSDLSEENRIRFDHLIEMHVKLKDFRNASNHAVEGVRVSVKQMKKLIEDYIECFEQIDM